MIGWLRNLNEGERKVVIEQAAIRCAVPSQAIEKDWWITLALKAMFQTAFAPYLLFKGGTSLSKCWKLITRFSEDIDLSIDRSVLGYQGDLSRSKIKELKRDAAQFTSSVLKDALIEQLQSLGVPDGMVTVTAEEIKSTQPDKDPQALFLHYPTLFRPLHYLPNVVKIEVSALSLREPFADCEVRSMLQEYFPSDEYEEQPFAIPAIEPQRTFLEKAFLLHEELARPDKLRAERKSRHFYDLVMLMDGKHGQAALENMTLYDNIVKHRSLFNKLNGVDYSTHSPDKINFIPELDLLDRFENDYAVMRDQMIYGESLPFPKLIEKLRVLRWRFRDKKPVPLPYDVTAADIIERARKSAKAQGWLDNPPEGTFISTLEHYNSDIYKPITLANIDRVYKVSFVISEGKLIPDDIQVLPNQ
jgi:hypothetical protein